MFCCCMDDGEPEHVEIEGRVVKLERSDTATSLTLEINEQTSLTQPRPQTAAAIDRRSTLAETANDYQRTKKAQRNEDTHKMSADEVLRLQQFREGLRRGQSNAGIGALAGFKPMSESTRQSIDLDLGNDYRVEDAPPAALTTRTSSGVFIIVAGNRPVIEESVFEAHYRRISQTTLPDVKPTPTPTASASDPAMPLLTDTAVAANDTGSLDTAPPTLAAATSSAPTQSVTECDADNNNTIPSASSNGSRDNIFDSHKEADDTVAPSLPTLASSASLNPPELERAPSSASYTSHFM